MSRDSVGFGALRAGPGAWLARLVALAWIVGPGCNRDFQDCPTPSTTPNAITLRTLLTPTGPPSPGHFYDQPPSSGRIVIVPEVACGQLTVTSVFGNGYVLHDPGGPGAEPGFDHLYIFTFGLPMDGTVPGAVLDSASGNLSLFGEFPELNFPVYAPLENRPVGTLPVPRQLVASDLGQDEKLLPWEASTVEVTGAVCRPDPTKWAKYLEFPIDLGGGDCSGAGSINVGLPARWNDFDPTLLEGRMVTAIGALFYTTSAKEATTPATPCKIDADCAALSAAAHCSIGSCKSGTSITWIVSPRTRLDVVQR